MTGAGMDVCMTGGTSQARQVVKENSGRERHTCDRWKPFIDTQLWKYDPTIHQPKQFISCLVLPTYPSVNAPCAERSGRR